MDKETIQNWGERFTADLEVDGERVPLDRVIAAHLPVVECLRARGLTWRAIAAIITKAGGRRANGRPISPDQLRADVSRLIKRQTRKTDVASIMPAPPGRSLDEPAVAPRTVSVRRPALSPPRATVAKTLLTQSAPPASMTSGGSKDVSDSDIAAALARLKHSS